VCIAGNTRNRVLAPFALQLCYRQQENAHYRSPALDEAELYYVFSPPVSDEPCRTIRERWVVRIRADHAILVGTRNTERPNSLSTRWLDFSINPAKTHQSEHTKGSVPFSKAQLRHWPSKRQSIVQTQREKYTRINYRPTYCRRIPARSTQLQCHPTAMPPLEYF
jgi:hypothetical protein